MKPQEIVDFLQRHRFPLEDEKACQREIGAAFAAAGVDHEREVRLSDADRIDFMVGDVGLEIKIKGQRRAIYRQVERYCHHDRIAALVLATNAAMGMPAFINGRPIVIARLGMAWL